MKLNVSYLDETEKRERARLFHQDQIEQEDEQIDLKLGQLSKR